MNLEVQPDRTSFLESRRKFIGASDSPAILGCGYADQSPITVWESKVYGVYSQEETDRMAIGAMMEDSLRQIFSWKTKLQCVPCFKSRIHKTIPWLGCSPDGLAFSEPGDFLGPVELKNPSYFERADWADEDHPPLKFQIQVQHQLAVMDCEYGYLFGLIGGNEPVVRKIKRDDRFIEALIERLAEFWGYVQRRELPPVDPSEATSRALSRIFPVDDGETVQLPDEADEWAAILDKAKAVKASAENSIDGASNSIKALIGNATCGITPSGIKYTWKRQERKAREVKASSYRVLRKVSK